MATTTLKLYKANGINLQTDQVEVRVFQPAQDPDVDVATQTYNSIASAVTMNLPTPGAWKLEFKNKVTNAKFVMVPNLVNPGGQADRQSVSLPI